MIAKVDQLVDPVLEHLRAELATKDGIISTLSESLAKSQRELKRLADNERRFRNYADDLETHVEQNDLQRTGMTELDYEGFNGAPHVLVVKDGTARLRKLVYEWDKPEA